MSKVKVINPIIHVPSFKEYSIDGTTLAKKILALGFTLPVYLLDSIYYYTDLEGWGNILWDLTFNVNLGKPEKFDCDNYSLKAMSECAERYGLNTLGLVIGNIPEGRHAFNILFHGDGFMFHEPNSGFGYGGLFEIGENNYVGEWVII